MHAGTWCSGITSALHAEGPGFNPQCVHAWFLDELLIDTLVDWRSRWAHGVVVSHPLCMRKALGSNPSVSNVGLRPCCAHQGRAFHVGRRSSPQVVPPQNYQWGCLTGPRRSKASCHFALVPVGTWCSGITSASHAEGPGFNPQCVQRIKFALVTSLGRVTLSQGFVHAG